MTPTLTLAGDTAPRACDHCGAANPHGGLHRLVVLDTLVADDPLAPLQSSLMTRYGCTQEHAALATVAALTTYFLPAYAQPFPAAPSTPAVSADAPPVEATPPDSPEDAPAPPEVPSETPMLVIPEAAPTPEPQPDTPVQEMPVVVAEASPAEPSAPEAAPETPAP